MFNLHILVGLVKTGWAGRVPAGGPRDANKHIPVQTGVNCVRRIITSSVGNEVVVRTEAPDGSVPCTHNGAIVGQLGNQATGSVFKCNSVVPIEFSTKFVVDIFCELRRGFARGRKALSRDRGSKDGNNRRDAGEVHGV